MPIIALTREVPAQIAACELTHLERTPIDYVRAAAQHASYEAVLRAAGCAITRLPPTPDLPDSVFVEDAAIVFEDIAVIARPGAPSRRAEVYSVAAALEPYRTVRWIEDPGTLDGGDVLHVGRRVFVGLSTRTNRSGAAQLAALVAPFGYVVDTIETQGCLHLKSAATCFAPDSLLINPAWLDVDRLRAYHLLEVHPDEPFAANVLHLGDAVVCAAAFPRTRERLERQGLTTVPVDVSELAKAEAGVTCCSVIIHRP